MFSEQDKSWFSRTRVKIGFLMMSLMCLFQNWGDMLNDGLHLSTEGSDFLFELLKPVLEKHTRDLPMLYPYWADIDNENPSEELNKHF